MAKVQEYRDQSVEQLELVHEDLRKALFSLRNERRETGQMEKPHQSGKNGLEKTCFG